MSSVGLGMCCFLLTAWLEPLLPQISIWQNSNFFSRTKEPFRTYHPQKTSLLQYIHPPFSLRSSSSLPFLIILLPCLIPLYTSNNNSSLLPTLPSTPDSPSLISNSPSQSPSHKPSSHPSISVLNLYFSISVSHSSLPGLVSFSPSSRGEGDGKHLWNFILRFVWILVLWFESLRNPRAFRSCFRRGRRV